MYLVFGFVLLINFCWSGPKVANHEIRQKKVTVFAPVPHQFSVVIVLLFLLLNLLNLYYIWCVTDGRVFCGTLRTHNRLAPRFRRWLADN